MDQDYKDFEFDPEQHLIQVSKQEDDEIDLFMCALAFSALDHEGVHLQRYIHHIETLTRDVKSHYESLLKKDYQDGASLRIRALRDVLVDDYGYIGDAQNYDNLQNASLIHVIDRAKGLPVALSILYISVASRLGWDVVGLRFPGHFLCRIEMAGERIIFDPFSAALYMDAACLRQLLKTSLGPSAELSSSFYEPATSREILIRLENNLKSRKIEAEDYQGALKHVLRMIKIAPKDYRLEFDAGVLFARVEQTQAAIKHLSLYLEKAPNGHHKHDAELLLIELRQSLN